MRRICCNLLAALLVSAGPALAAGGGEQRQAAGDRLFARLTTGRKDLFQQEVFDLALLVYSRGLNLGREITLLDLEAPGLSFLPFRDLGNSREQVDGKVFDVRRFRGRAQAVAAGTFTIRPTVRTAVVVPGRGRDRDRPGEPRPVPAEVRTVDLHPPPLTVEVRPLPEAGKPAGFTGAVGSFTFSAAARPSAVAEGEPVTLTMEIRGRGNLESATAPRVQASERFNSYEPKLLRKEDGGDRSPGLLVFEQVVIPRVAGSLSLPAVTFDYFDPVRKSYRSLVGGPFPLAVAPMAAAGAAVVGAPASGPAARRPLPGLNLAPLKPEPRDWTGVAARSRRPSPWFLALQLVPPAILAALFLGLRHRARRTGDVAAARRQLAPRAARAGIDAAERALRQGDPVRFHEALWEALFSYFGHRLNLLPGEVSAETVTARLSLAGLDPGDLARLGEIFRLLEQERFARPSSAPSPLTARERQRLAGVLDELGRLLRACEQAPW